MCPAMAMGGVGHDAWKADVYEAASLTFRVSSRISTAVDGYAKLLGIVRALWKLDSVLKKFLEAVYTAAESPKPNQVVVPDSAEVAETMATLRGISEQIERMYESAQRKGLTNRSVVGTALNSVRVHGDEILDLVESIEAALNPNVDAIIERTLAEYKRGEVHDLAELK